MKNAKTVDEFLARQESWVPLLEKLRRILLSTELEETIKWGTPVYTLKRKNIVGIGAFKSYAGLWFFQGALLSDPKKILVNAQEGKTKALRQLRFYSIDEIDENVIRAYVDEAIENQKAGREIKPPKKKPITIPAELEQAMAEDEALKKSFGAFSHSHKREFAEYIDEAKRAETRQRRLEKVIPMIKSKGGLNDKYR